MKIDIDSNILKAFMKETGCTAEYIKSKLEYIYRDEGRKMEIQIDALKPADLTKLHDFIQLRAKGDSKLSGIARKITTYLNLKADPAGSTIGGLEALVTALKNYIKPSRNKWLFSAESNGEMLPYFVGDIKYHPAQRDSPAYTQMSLMSMSRGSKNDNSVTWHQSELTGRKRTVVALLEDAGYYLETNETFARYCEEMATYKEIHEGTGEQYNATGYGKSSGGRWYSGTDTAMERDGHPTKVVMDDMVKRGDDEDTDAQTDRDNRMVSTLFWTGKLTDDDDELEGDGSVAAPVHPYVLVFDLVKHRHVTIHVNNLEPYQYDDKMADKLILPADTKDLIHILVQGSNDQMDDIVKGKTGGTIVIATGPPGTGKTLTAEVFSEAVKRPLYVVQCSQLGTNEEALGKHLTRVLQRATRWKAILLIDEADVYVHERGADIQQNAIVGVFLRVLEYYQGILFMTSNRATVIDDAIMSRAVAWIQYNNPPPPDQVRIWAVLAAQFKIDASTLPGLELVKQFPGISGRNIKNLLKLARRLSIAKNKPIDVEMLVYVSKFLDLDGTDKKVLDGRAR